MAISTTTTTTLLGTTAFLSQSNPTLSSESSKWINYEDGIYSLYIIWNIVLFYKRIDVVGPGKIGEDVGAQKPESGDKLHSFSKMRGE